MRQLIKKILKEETSKKLDFDRIYSTMWNKMLNQVCMKYTNDIDKAKDFCQNGFVKVYNNLHKYQEGGSLEGWVRRVINNSILDELRKSKMKFVDGEDGFDFSRLDMDDEIEIDDSELKASEIRKALPKLPPSQRKAIEMFFLDGLSHEEIANELNISLGTSKTNLMKAKDKMKNLLNKLN